MENKVLAIVNGREVTDMDLQQNIARFPRERQSYFSSEEGKRRLLDQVISYELIYNYAKDTNIDSDIEFKTQLENVEKEILTQYTINKVLSEIQVSDEEIKEYYENNENMFVGQETVRAKHILVETIDKASQIVDEIREGLSFEEAASKYSSCPSKAQGGDLGQFTRGSMVPEFEEVAFKLNIGEVSEPVKTQFGYHLIKVEEKGEQTSKKFDEVEVEIRNNILQEKQNKKYMELTMELKDKYQVVLK